MAVIFDKQLSHIQLKQTFAYLSEFETGVPADKTMEEYIYENGNFLSIYNPYAISPDKSTIRIGTKQKDNRVCRFCNKTMPEVTFKNKSHTISHALGNICFITNDECDSCNKKFGLSIEQDFFHYVEMFNSLAHNNFRLGGIDFSKEMTVEDALKLASEHQIEVQEHEHTVGHIINLFFENFFSKSICYIHSINWLVTIT